MLLLSARHAPRRRLSLVLSLWRQVGMSPSGLPPLAMPERFQIVYRDSGISTPLTIWRPVPPKG